mmetsp:Transcript_45641/g.98863  ORF Transcript_45641/g.98863 Transcript_45641/m.98863 type:complete len:131 (+) Transcript_45641:146-538(+)
MYPAVPVKDWEDGGVVYTKGEDNVQEFQMPNGIKMVKYSCKTCGQVIMNSNKFNFRVFSLDAVRRSNNGKVPPGMNLAMHLFYSEKVCGPVVDGLPKFVDFPQPMGSGKMLDDDGNPIESLQPDNVESCG